MELTPFKQLIKARSGLRFEDNGEAALLAALNKRLMATAETDPLVYHQRLEGDETELNALLSLLTINETYFYREPDHLRLLVEHVVPARLAEGGQSGEPVRILSVGCSTGEEPYSILMALTETFGESAANLFRVCGGDIDHVALERARQGVYGRFSFRALSKALWDRYFQPVDAHQWAVNPALRRQVTLQPLNLLHAENLESLPQQDVIFFRNVSIYFDLETRRGIIQRLADRLVDGGTLFVGATESFSNDFGFLRMEEKAGHFLFRKLPPLITPAALGVPTPAPLRSGHGGGGRFDRRNGSATRRQSPPSLAPAPGAARALATATPMTGGAKEAGARCSVPAQTRQGDPRGAAEVTATGVGRAAARNAAELSLDDRLEQVVGLMDRKDYTDALAQLESLITHHPRDARPLTLQAQVLFNQRRFDAARAAAQAALAQDEWAQDALLVLGHVARVAEQWAEATRWFKQVIYLCPEHWPAHYHLADAYRRQGQTEPARREYRIVLRQLRADAPADGRSRQNMLSPLSVPVADVRMVCERHLNLLANPNKN